MRYSLRGSSASFCWAAWCSVGRALGTSQVLKLSLFVFTEDPYQAELWNNNNNNNNNNDDDDDDDDVGFIYEMVMLPPVEVAVVVMRLGPGTIVWGVC